MNDSATIVGATFAEQIELARSLFVEYQQWLNVSLCFQGFDQELAELPGKYAAPSGRLFLAYFGGTVAGCIALRPMDDEGACEMKRLYVRDIFRGKGIGKLLTRRILDEARTIGYRTMRLDTLHQMEAARALYVSLGFIVTPAYYNNPLDDVVYMELQL